MMNKSRYIEFTEKRIVDVKDEHLLLEEKKEIFQTIISAISHGTERLVLSGKVSSEHQLDATLTDYDNSIKFPLKYGYQSVVKSQHSDEYFFGFLPHQEFHLQQKEHLIQIPKGIDNEDAVFFANAETTINLCLDIQPVYGENIAVIGCGLLGLMSISALQQFPVKLSVFDLHDHKLQIAENIDGVKTYNVNAQSDIELIYDSFDVVLDLSGSRKSVIFAEKLLRQDGRLVIGSWYGDESENFLGLSTSFHRKRITIQSSQVSHINVRLQSRYNKVRLQELTWELIRNIRPSKWITGRFSLNEASDVYRILLNETSEHQQFVFNY